MATSLRFALPLALLAVACSNSSPSSHDHAGGANATGTATPTPAQPTVTPAPATSTGADAQQAITEADIIQISGGHLFALSNTGTLSVIDISKPNQLVLLGEAYLPGTPFEMYLLANDRLAVMLAAPAGGSTLVVLDAHDPTLMQRIGTTSIAGDIGDSRMVGDLLYLVTGGSLTVVTSFDLAAQNPVAQVGQLVMNGASPNVVFGNGRMYLGGNTGVDLVDVSDTTGKIAKGAHITTVGPITERWQMSENDGVLRVVSQGAGTPVIETFQIWNPNSVQAMGNAVLTLPSVEPLKSVRFDTDRAYAITFKQTDPLFVIDLKNPMQPVPRGQITMPGYMFDLEPHGNRLIGLGVDQTAEDHLNVSLFDVTDMDHPSMLQRVSFGGTTGDLPEDQNRIQKAFQVAPDGLITIPMINTTGTEQCAIGGGIQLVDWKQDTLTARPFLMVAGNPRRALWNQNAPANQKELIAVSDSNVTAFDVTVPSLPFQTADLVVGTCAIHTQTIVPPSNGSGILVDDTFAGDDDMGEVACSTSRGLSPRGSRGSYATVLVGLGLALAAGVRRRRAHSRAS